MAAPPADIAGAMQPGERAVVTLPSERQIRIVRRFRAPRLEVFDAWTEADRIAEWWDPRRLRLAVCEVDLRPGGSFRFVPQGPAGAAVAFAGEYREVEPPARLVFAIPGPSAGQETVGALNFAEHGGHTTLTITMTCATQADRDALLRARVDEGTARTLDNLERHLSARST